MNHRTTAAIGAQHTQARTWVGVGVIGGIVAGIAFAMFEMIMAATLNGSEAFFMPLRMIGGIALGPSAIDPATSMLPAGAAGLAGIFGWTWFPDSQNVAVQLVAHTFMFGTVLGIVLDRFAFRANRCARRTRIRPPGHDPRRRAGGRLMPGARRIWLPQPVSLGATIRAPPGRLAF